MLWPRSQWVTEVLLLLQLRAAWTIQPLHGGAWGRTTPPSSCPGPGLHLRRRQTQHQSRCNGAGASGMLGPLGVLGYTPPPASLPSGPSMASPPSSFKHLWNEPVWMAMELLQAQHLFPDASRPWVLATDSN